MSSHTGYRVGYVVLFYRYTVPMGHQAFKVCFSSNKNRRGYRCSPGDRFNHIAQGFTGCVNNVIHF
jgi:hypothetical protein